MYYCQAPQHEATNPASNLAQHRMYACMYVCMCHAQECNLPGTHRQRTFCRTLTMNPCTPSLGRC